MFQGMIACASRNEQTRLKREKACNSAQQSLPGTIRLCSPQEAAALVRSGDKIAISANANTPRVWLEALFARAEQLEDVEIMHMRLVGLSPRRRLTSQHIRFNPLLVPEALRAGGCCRVRGLYPGAFSPDQQSLCRRAAQLDVAVAVAPPTADGTCSYGAYVGFMEQACRVARTVIAEVNERMPQTYGPARLPLAYADAVIATDYLPRKILGRCSLMSSASSALTWRR